MWRWRDSDERTACRLPDHAFPRQRVAGHSGVVADIPGTAPLGSQPTGAIAAGSRAYVRRANGVSRVDDGVEYGKNPNVRLLDLHRPIDKITVLYAWHKVFSRSRRWQNDTYGTYQPRIDFTDRGFTAHVKDSSLGCNAAGTGIHGDTALHLVDHGFQNGFLLLHGEGGVGGIAGRANIWPSTVASIYNRFIAGDLEGAQQAQDAIAILQGVFRFGNPNTIIKTAVAMLGYPVGQCRRPFSYLCDEGVEALKQVLENNKSLT